MPRTLTGASRRVRLAVAGLSLLVAAAVTTVAALEVSHPAGNAPAHHVPAPRALRAGALTAGDPQAPFTLQVSSTPGCGACARSLTALAPSLAPARDAHIVRLVLKLPAPTTPQAAAVDNAIACASDENVDTAASYALTLLSTTPTPQGTPGLARAAGAAHLAAAIGCIEHGTYLPWLHSQQRLAASGAAVRLLLNGAPTTEATVARLISGPVLP